MDRENRFDETVKPLDETTAIAFEGAVRRGVKKAVRAKRRRLVLVSSASAVFLLLSFVACVNVSPAFAMAMGRVPLLGELVKIVSFDKGYQAALQNDYFQPLGISREKDGVAVNIGGIIADDGELIVFWDVSGDTAGLDVQNPDIRLKDASGAPMVYTAYWYSSDNVADMYSRQFVLLDATLPDTVLLDVKFGSPVPEPTPLPWEAVEYPEGFPVPEETAPPAPKPPVSFEFRLDIDPSLRRPGIEYPINKTMELAEGVSVVVEKLVVYPAHARLFYHDDPANMQRINNISFTLSNELGETYESQTGFGDFLLLMESTFFSKAKHLSLRCDFASFLPKGDDSIAIDPATGRVCDQNASWLIPVSVERENGTLRLTYTIKKELLIEGNEGSIPFTYPITDDGGNVIADCGSMECTTGDGAPLHTLILPDVPIVGMLHVPIGISPPIAVNTEEIIIK